jgi:enoyl-CoA hydratase
MTDSIRYTLADGIAHLTMDDGKVNAMTLGLMESLGRVLDRAEQEARVLVLRSARPNLFSAGFDLKVFASGDLAASSAMVRCGAELALRLMGFTVPTLGVMTGHAYPMGAFLLLACDWRIGQQGPARVGLNEVAIRITPPRFAIELARSRMHPAWLSRTVTLGEMFGPDDALNAGLLDEVQPAEALESAVHRAIDRLATIHQPSHV